MKFELDSMYSNQVWDLVKVPNGIKPVGCKWVYCLQEKERDIWKG